MVATTTHSISWLIRQLRRDHPDILFRVGTTDAWNPNQVIVYYRKDADSPDQILHELGHALLAHTSYKRDIELLSMERAAWEEAQKVASKYDIRLDPESIEAQMDSYRDWLHARSTCPQCEANGFQIDSDLYRCLSCEAVWRVNDARTCGLRRYVVTTKQPLV